MEGTIHSTKISRNFGPKLNGSVRSNRKSFEKNESTFWGGPLFPVRPVGILVEWTLPGAYPPDIIILKKTLNKN